MSMNPVSFESSWKKAKEREVIKEARQRVLEKAEANAERRMRREQLEASWMLPSLEERLKEKKSSKKSKKEKKKERKERKKEKKMKKEKKKKKKRSRSTSDSSTSSEESDEWVEKDAETSSQYTQKEPEQVITQRQGWMLSETTSNDDANHRSEAPNFDFLVSEDKRIRSKERRAEERRAEEQSKAKVAAQRELNPDMKDDKNKTLASKNEVQTSSSSLSSDWLRRALRRAHEQAEREQRSVEEVAAERWGSLERLQMLLNRANEAESNRHNNNSNAASRYKSDFRDRNRDRGYDRGHNGRGSWRRQERDENTERRREEERRRSRSPPPSKSDKISATKTETVKRRRRSTSSSSSSSSSSQERVGDRKQDQIEEEIVEELSESEMNALGAKIVRAELMGNEALAQQLKQRLELARKNVAESKTNADSVSKKEDHRREPEVRLKKQPKSKFVSQAPSSSSSLRSMFVSERDSVLTNADLTLATKHKLGNDLDENFDRIDDSKSHVQEELYKQQEAKAMLRQERIQNQALTECRRCLNSQSRHLLIAIGEKCYLSVPHHESLTQHHCLITPNDHVASLVDTDEDVYQEMLKFRAALSKLFDERGEDCIFFETVINLGRFPHTQLHCVPINREELLLDPSAYFQKAIEECEMEWSDNRKLIKIDNKKGLKRSVPKKLPYFFVGCGRNDLFAHVIEDERTFPLNFAQEIIGGMLELDPHLWRRPQRESFETQKRKVLGLGEIWAKVDFTKQRTN